MNAFKPLSLLPIIFVPLLLAQTAPAPKSASLTGTIKSTDPLTRIVAVDRAWAEPIKVTADDPKDEFVYPGTIDPKTGIFSIKGLLPNRPYDLIVWTKPADAPAIRWEGISMDYQKEVTPAPAITPADKEWLTTFVEKTPRFEDKCRILWLAADHQHATALVELARDREFHSGTNGDIIVRTELWYFENYFGGWAKDANTEKVIMRWRGKAAAFPDQWQFLPTLGGLSAADAKPLAITLPAKPDPKHGPSKAEWSEK